MTPMYKIARKGQNPTKRIVKLIGLSSDPRLQHFLLQRSPDSVFKSICNAFYNIAENPDIQIPKGRRIKLAKYNKVIQKLIAKDIPLVRKRRIIQRGGGIFLAAILPAVISTALSYLGSSFIKTQ